MDRDHDGARDDSGGEQAGGETFGIQSSQVMSPSGLPEQHRYSLEEQAGMLPGESPDQALDRMIRELQAALAALPNDADDGNCARNVMVGRLNKLLQVQARR